MRVSRSVNVVLSLTAVVGVLVGGFLTRERWLPWLSSASPAEMDAEPTPDTPATKVLVSDQAQKNLGLTSRPILPQTFWKTIPVPGMVVDRPGHSDRGVVAPAAGVVSKIARFPGEAVRPGELLFTLKLLSEPLHQTQTELFKTTQDITLALAQRKRLATSTNIPEARMIEADQQITRLQVAAKASRQELLNRGLTLEQIEKAAEGQFVREISVLVPASPADARPLTASLTTAVASGPASPALAYEVQELKAELGQQVQAGQTLCVLANHQRLAVEGRAFRDETPLLERSVKEGWPVEVDFQEDARAGWPALDQSFQIRHLANTIDPVNRTFAFLMPLENQSRAVENGERTQLLWRFRPGQKVRVQVRVEKLDNVFVLPSDAVAREGAEAFVFTQNVNTFVRIPVRVLLQERQYVVLANDGSVVPGVYVAQSAAAQLNRMTKSGANTGVPKGYHIHADGSLHKNHD